MMKKRSEKGIALLITIILTGTLLLVATSIMNTAVKQAFLSASGRESQYAFYAADTGAECALYWDVHDPQGVSAFTTPSSIYCNKDAVNPSNQFQVGSAPVSTFTMTFLPEPYCATVTVTKSGSATTIESKGYNTCDTANPRRVERAVRINY
jgi:Tfp pilus assembly protein PilX